MEKERLEGRPSEFARQAGTKRSSFLSDYLYLVKTTASGGCSR